MINARPLGNRFWSKVEKTKGCWNWSAATFHHGYGCFGVKVADGKYKTRYAHRLAYEELVGPIVDGLFVLHKCDNRRCVNPEHLFLGTQVDNMRDCSAKGRKPGKRLFGEENYAAKLSDAKIKIIRYVGKSLSQQRLGDVFGVSQTMIGCVLRGKSWPHVKVVE